MGKIPDWGGGGIKKGPISIWELRKSRRGLNFSKMSEFQNLTFIEDEKWACIRYQKSKMPEFDPRGAGGSGFFKNVWNLKRKSELSDVGGGIKPIWEFSKKFSYFNYDDSPNLVQLI